MNKKKTDIIKNSIELHNNSIDMDTIMKTKIVKIQNIIQNTIISITLYKKYSIFSSSEIIICLSTLNDIYMRTTSLYTYITDKNIEGFIDKLQNIVDKISLIITSFGTNYIEDLLFILFGSEFISKMNISDSNKHKYELIKQFVHPINYKVLHWKQTNKQRAIERLMEPFILCSNKMGDDTLHIELANNLECFDIDKETVKSYHTKVYGLRIVIHNEKAQKTIIIQCICDDISLDCISNQYIDLRIKELCEITVPVANQDIMKRIIDTLTLKDILVFGPSDIQKRLIMINTDVNMVLDNKIDIVIKKFIEMDMFLQRNMLIHLLIYNKNDEVQYITYLLYDLITINTHVQTGQVDTMEQIILYDSFPLKVKTYFKEAMKYTLNYSCSMMKKYDTNMITMEQRIYLLKVPENVKEKAMAKFKELKGKSDDTGTKAKQYLDGLLKIPFGIYKQEPILNVIQDINTDFLKVIAKKHELNNHTTVNHTTVKSKYTNIDILKYITGITNNLETIQIKDYINSTLLLKTINDIYNYINNQSLQRGKTKNEKIQNIIHYLDISPSISINDKCQLFDIINPSKNSIATIIQEYNELYKTVKNVETTMDIVVSELDASIYGHTYAKNQILKIVGQWMNGEQTGYCFGFEGSPGIGKTSLAKKGLSNCLKDANGVSRPFAFIALGGSCNGSTLEGHSYTYVNSIWGRIVDILMETKCMNPIIYIDELDKVSKTEHGKEIIGILTHIIDSTQNDGFQDKYFSGIDIDLSKVLFIFSYNDPEQIDRILLDRIHRIKFDNLSITDKTVVVRKHILPEINKKMGLDESTIVIDDAIIEYIADNYTMEPGIRKLKEILFDIYGEINIEILKCKEYETIQLPIRITVDLVKTKYLKKYTQIQEKIINKCIQIGIINGLWANSLGKGGIIPIETMFFPSSTFLDLKLTGLQGDVMKESMNVAKSLAWSLTPDCRKTELIEYFEKTKNNGIHIHCPDGAISKDGPSAGAAITSAIYSLLNNKPIHNEYAMTGEIDLRGNITAIGGLESKILGGIRAGITTFLYPDANSDDFNEFKSKYMVGDKYATIHFIPIKHITHVLEILQLV
jgi:ATP-dependent Lon protease